MWACLIHYKHVPSHLACSAKFIPLLFKRYKRTYGLRRSVGKTERLACQLSKSVKVIGTDTVADLGFYKGGCPIHLMI